MGREDIAAGRAKRTRGKANDIAGALTGNTGRQFKGKVQKVVGKVQETLGGARARGRATTTRRRSRI